MSDWGEHHLAGNVGDLREDRPIDKLPRDPAPVPEFQLLVEQPRSGLGQPEVHVFLADMDGNRLGMVRFAAPIWNMLLHAHQFQDRPPPQSGGLVLP